MRRFVPILVILIMVAFVGLPIFFVINKQKNMPEVDNNAPTKMVSESVTTEDGKSSDKDDKETEKNKDNDKDSKDKDKDTKNKKSKNKDSKKDDNKSGADDGLLEMKEIAAKYLTCIMNFDFDGMIEYMPDVLSEYGRDTENSIAGSMDKMKDILKQYKDLDISYSGNLGEFEKVSDNSLNKWIEFNKMVKSNNSYECTEIYECKCDLVLTVSYMEESQKSDQGMYLYAIHENGEWRMLSADYTFDEYLNTIYNLIETVE